MAKSGVMPKKGVCFFFFNHQGNGVAVNEVIDGSNNEVTLSQACVKS